MLEIVWMIYPDKVLNQGDDEPYEDVAHMAGDELVESPDDGGVFLDCHGDNSAEDGEEHSTAGDGGALP